MWMPPGNMWSITIAIKHYMNHMQANCICHFGNTCFISLLSFLKETNVGLWHNLPVFVPPSKKKLLNQLVDFYEIQ
jgi:hypothetical protein